MNNYHTPRDAGKDPVAVKAALEKLTDQQIAILHNFGVTLDICELTHGIIENALMMAIKTVERKAK